LLIYSRLIV